MKTRLILLNCIVLNICFLSNTYGQADKSVMELLTSKEWVYIPNSDKDLVLTITYKSNSHSGITRYKGQVIIDEPEKFYLSDVIETRFNENNVGKYSNGKYIIKLSRSGLYILEILRLTENILEVVSIDTKQLPPARLTSIIYNAKIGSNEVPK